MNLSGGTLTLQCSTGKFSTVFKTWVLLYYSTYAQRSHWISILFKQLIMSKQLKRTFNTTKNIMCKYKVLVDLIKLF